MSETTTRLDWFRIIDDLKRQGVSLYGIEVAIGVSVDKLFNYKRGGEPRHSDGEKLLRLWAQVTGKATDAAPREVIHVSVARARRL